MPDFDWNEFYKLAEEIYFKISDSNLQPLDHARIRTCIGRYYYAAFHCCKNYLADNAEVEVPVEGAHAKTVAEIHKRDPNLSNVLNELKAVRHKADYHHDWPFTKQNASDAQNKCDQIKYEIEERIRLRKK